MNTNLLTKEKKSFNRLNGFSFEDIGNDHLSTSLETPLKEDAFSISDTEKKRKNCHFV